MTNIIVVFQKIEDAKSIKNLLVRSGFRVTAVCTSGAQAISYADDFNCGIVICGYKVSDMIYSELHENLPSGFEMLLMASQRLLSDSVGMNIMSLAMPLKVHDLVNTVEMMSAGIERRRKKQKLKPKERNPEEEATIREAKELLMVRNHMTEEEAFRYIQKCSMDSSTNMVETAQMVLTMMQQ